MIHNEFWKDKDFTEHYVNHWREGMPMAHQQRDLILFLIQQLHPTMTKLLDIGCGGAFIGKEILHQYDEIEMVCVDFSEPMLELAKKTLQRFNQRTHFILQDINIPLWSKNVASYTPFDVIITGYVMHYVPDDRKKAIYQEIYDLLSPGGLLLTLEHIAASSPHLEQLHHEYFISSLYQYYTAFSNAITKEEIRTLYNNRPQQRANLLTPLESHLTWLQEAGYIEIEHYHHISQFSLFGGRKPRIIGKNECSQAPT